MNFTQPIRDAHSGTSLGQPTPKAASASLSAATIDPSADAGSIQAFEATLTDAPPIEANSPNSPVNMLPRNDPADKYKLRSEIARGGMGVVLEAHDTTLHRNVAMKVMINPRQASRQRVLRFIEEACITSQLQHPGIMPIHELGTDQNGNAFYTMKHVSGRTLKEVLNGLKEGREEMQNAFPLTRLINILQRVCDAIAYAHSRGVIHRDLKPDNIMIGDYGEVLVLDWGLAKVLGKKAQRHEGTEAQSRKSEVGGQRSVVVDQHAQRSLGEAGRSEPSEIGNRKSSIQNPVLTISTLWTARPSAPRATWPRNRQTAKWL